VTEKDTSASTKREAKRSNEWERDKEWHSSNLRGVLLKPRNAGIQTYSQWVEKPDGQRVRLTKETGAGNWKAIVSEGMFRALVGYLSDLRSDHGEPSRLSASVSTGPV
jgi:hypothetical protein